VPQCAEATAVYVCANATGTTCTKLAVSVYRTTPAPCNGGDVQLLTWDEYDSLMSRINAVEAGASSPSGGDPFRMSVEDGLLLSGAIAAAWALAWSMKAIAAVLRSDGEALD
jgi:hypothetical protein